MAKRWHRKRAAGVRTPSMSVTPTCQNVWYRELKHPVSENKSLWMFLVLVPVSFRSSTMRDNVWGNKARSAVALCSLPVHRLGTTLNPIRCGVRFIKWSFQGVAFRLLVTSQLLIGFSVVSTLDSAKFNGLSEFSEKDADGEPASAAALVSLCLINFGYRLRQIWWRLWVAML